MYYDYLIAGGGMAAAAALKSIHKIDDIGSIGVIGEEPFKPYKRPYLSKQLWKGKPIESAWINLNGIPADFMLGRQVKELQPDKKSLTDDQGEEFTYNKLLIATGGTPRKLPYGEDNIIYFRNMADYNKLTEIAAKGDKFVIIGGGFIGSEIAAALAMNGKKVTMVFPEDAIGFRAYPGDISSYINDYYREKGVTVINGDLPVDVKDNTVITKSGVELPADGIIAGIGILPNVEIAGSTEIKIDNGIVVDGKLRTHYPDIFAAGDVANFYSPILDKHIRVEHENNANRMGAVAGNVMAGGDEFYNFLPFFYSDMFDLGYEAVGELDSRMDIYADWKEKYKEGVIYYMTEGRVRGVLLWNVWEKVDTARELILSSAVYDINDLKGKITG